MSYKQMNKGFTLIELVFVIILLAVLVAVAIPKFLSFSTDAKISVLKQVQTSIKVANDFMLLKSKMPSYAARDVPNRDDLIDVDTNGDGVYDTRLKWGHLDNTGLDKAVDFLMILLFKNVDIVIRLLVMILITMVMSAMMAVIFSIHKHLQRQPHHST